MHLTEEDIISTYAGYRPLVKPRATKMSSAKLSRSHVVLQSPSGLVSIMGGKLTTYRRMAQDTVDVLSQRDGSKPIHPTENLPLHGSAGWPVKRKELASQAATLGLDIDIMTHLGHSYGTEAETVIHLVAENASLAKRLIDDLPYIRAEVIYACRYEMAMTPYDVLARRTSITLEDRQRGLGILDEVANLMATEHQWSVEQRRTLVDTYRSSIEDQMTSEVKV